MAKYQRNKFFVDASVQGALIVRTFMYWLMCLTTLTIWLVGWRVLTEPADLFANHLVAVWSQFGPAAIASLLLLPIVIFDIVRMSHRFAGPMFRMRRDVRNVLQGETIDELRLRDDDYWQEFANDLNKILLRYQDLRRETTATMKGEATALPTESTVNAIAV